MLSLQYLFEYFRGSHLNHHMVDKTYSRGACKEGHTNLEGEVQRYKREPLDPKGYQAGLSGINTDAVTDAISNIHMNGVLEVHPPPYIASEERRLPRQISFALVRNICETFV